MEFLLLLWDELDDWAGACRHVAASAANEVAVVTTPLAAVGSAVGTWVVLSHSRLLAALYAGATSIWGSYRHLLDWAG